MISALLMVVALFLFSYVYMKIAPFLGIIDIPNSRSSHIEPTIRGGGIIFLVALTLFFITSSYLYPFFLTGALLLGIVSFIDDIYPLNPILRLFVQAFALVLMFYEVNIDSYNYLIIVLLFIFCLAFLNIYNFMDGINGMTGLNSMVILLPMIYINIFEVKFISLDLLLICLYSLVIFGFYNFRVKAICFAGDVGSITMGFILIFAILKLFLTTNEPHYFLFFLIYVLDGGMTILERLLRKENILKPHRHHLYEILIDQKNFKHLNVSLVYAGLQFLLSSIIIISINTQSLWVIYLFVFLYFIIYAMAKMKNRRINE